MAYPNDDGEVEQLYVWVTFGDNGAEQICRVPGVDGRPNLGSYPLLHLTEKQAQEAAGLALQVGMRTAKPVRLVRLARVETLDEIHPPTI